jgi:hypothetical protein
MADGEGNDQSRLRAALARLERTWSRLGLAIADAAAPGLDEEVVRSTLSVLDLEAPAELVTWFGWHNGASTSPYMREALPGWWLLTLDECVDRFLSHRDFGRPEGWAWVETLFPIMAMDAYRLLAEVRPGSPTVPIHVGPRDDEPHGPYASSLLDLIEFAVLLMEGPAVTMNEEHGFLALDRSHPAVQTRAMLF